jgi:GNAT superfamily N-acetyltransferase
MPHPPLIEDATAADLEEVRTLLRAYAAWLGIDLGFQRFEDEVARLPGDYVPPDGALLVARGDAGLTGMVALRRLDADRAEMKRLFVRSDARGTGLGRRLAERIIAEARARGYREICLDTLPVMQDAQRLYSRLGFRDVEAYYPSPVAGTRYMSLAL